MFSLVTDSLKSVGRATIGSTATDYLSQKVSDTAAPFLEAHNYLTTQSPTWSVAHTRLGLVSRSSPSVLQKGIAFVGGVACGVLSVFGAGIPAGTTEMLLVGNLDDSLVPNTFPLFTTLSANCVFLIAGSGLGWLLGKAADLTTDIAFSRLTMSRTAQFFSASLPTVFFLSPLLESSPFNLGEILLIAGAISTFLDDIILRPLLAIQPEFQPSQLLQNQLQARLLLQNHESSILTPPAA